MKRPQAILFDYGDTLLKITGWDYEAGHRALHDAADNPRSVPFEAIMATSERIVNAEREIKAVSPAECHVHGFHRMLFDRFGMTFRQSPEELERMYWDAAVSHELTDGLRELLDAMETHGIRAAIVSNATFRGCVLEHELRKYDLADRFEFVMSSAEYNFTKPHTLLYEAALGRLNLPAEAVWFAGDRCNTDVKGANAAGMTSIWYTGAIERERSEAADMEIRHWSQLIQALETCEAPTTDVHG
jgi:HAD superfamily hydrolase (TIGR01549 family)